MEMSLDDYDYPDDYENDPLDDLTDGQRDDYFAYQEASKNRWGIVKKSLWLFAVVLSFVWAIPFIILGAICIFLIAPIPFAPFFFFIGGYPLSWLIERRVRNVVSATMPKAPHIMHVEVQEQNKGGKQ